MYSTVDVMVDTALSNQNSDKEKLYEKIAAGHLMDVPFFYNN